MHGSVISIANLSIELNRPKYNSHAPWELILQGRAYTMCTSQLCIHISCHWLQQLIFYLLIMRFWPRSYYKVYTEYKYEETCLTPLVYMRFVKSPIKLLHPWELLPFWQTEWMMRVKYILRASDWQNSEQCTVLIFSQEVQLQGCLIDSLWEMYKFCKCTTLSLQYDASNRSRLSNDFKIYISIN